MKVTQKHLKGDLKDFPIEVVEKMLENQLKHTGKEDINIFIKNKFAENNGFHWSTSEEGYDFWDKVIGKNQFDLFFKKYGNQENQTHPGVYRMNREGVFSPSKHTENQCGKEGTFHYSYLLTIIVRNKLDNKGFIIDHDDLNNAIQNTEIFGSCEEMQRIIHKTVINTLPQGVLLGYKCVIKPLDFGSKAFIEFIECNNPEYFSLL